MFYRLLKKVSCRFFAKLCGPADALENPIGVLIDRLKDDRRHQAMEYGVKKATQAPMAKNTVWLLDKEILAATEIYRFFSLERLEQDDGPRKLDH